MTDADAPEVLIKQLRALLDREPDAEDVEALDEAMKARASEGAAEAKQALIDEEREKLEAMVEE